MGKVTRTLEFRGEEKMKEFLKEEFDHLIILSQEDQEFKNQELNDILVNLNVQHKNNGVCLTISKLVTLKAFLLSKQQNMDIADLVFKIDRTMNMSKRGLTKTNKGILDDDSLKEFLFQANITIEQIEESSIKLSDNKRSVSVEYRNKSYDFNSIQLIEEF